MQCFSFLGEDSRLYSSLSHIKFIVSYNAFLNFIKAIPKTSHPSQTSKYRNCCFIPRTEGFSYLLSSHLHLFLFVYFSSFYPVESWSLIVQCVFIDLLIQCIYRHINRTSILVTGARNTR